MKTTAAALRELQDYFLTLEPRPNVREIAKIANIPYSTAARYLNGTTRQGLPDTVRALARALGREDLVSEVASSSEAAWVAELQRETREDQKETALHFERLIETKDEYAAKLNLRIDKLEAEKAALTAELASVRKRKRTYERIVVGLFLALLLYFIIFDLPYPDNGVTEVLLDIMGK